MRGIDMWANTVDADPAEDVSRSPARWCDRGFRFGTLGLGVSGADSIRAMVKLADQLQRAFQRMKATVAMVTDVHHPPQAGQSRSRTSSSAKRNRYPRPLVGHPANLTVLVRSVDCQSRTRG